MDNSQVNEMMERNNLLRKIEEDCLDSFDNQVTNDDDTMKDVLNMYIKDCKRLKSMLVKHHSNLKSYPQQLVELSAYFLELHSILSNEIIQSQNKNVEVSIDIDINRSIDNDQICDRKSKTFFDKDIQTEDVLFAEAIKVVTFYKELQTCQIFNNMGTQTDNIMTLNKGVQTNQYVFDTFICLNCNLATSQEATNEFDLSEGFDGIVFDTQAAILANEKANKTIVNRKSQVMPEYTVTQIIDRLNQDSEQCVDVVSTNPQLNEGNKIAIQKDDNCSVFINNNAVHMKTNSATRDKVVIENSNINISRVTNETQTKAGGKVDVLNNTTKPTTSRLLQGIDLDKAVQINTVTEDIEENVQTMLEFMKKREVYESKASTTRESLASSNLRISMSIPSRTKRKLCFNDSANYKNFIHPYYSDSDIDTPKMMRKLLRDDITIRFDTDTQNESLHVVQGLDSSIEMDQLNDTENQQPETSKQSNDKQLIPDQSFNDTHTARPGRKMYETFRRRDVTNKVKEQTQSKGCGSISLSNLLDDDVLKEFENDYITTNDKAHPIKETPARFELSESLYNCFDTFDWSNNKENQFAKKESDVLRSPKQVKILQDIRLKDYEYHTNEDIFKSDSEDIIENTPTKEPKNIIIVRSQNSSLQPTALNRIITPPLEFADDLNNGTIIIETQKKTRMTREVSESIQFIKSPSPIVNIQKKLNVGSQMKSKKQCSITNKDPTPSGSEIFKILSQPKMKVKPCISCSRLPKNEIRTIHELIRLNLATYSAVFTPNVTHMIVSTTKENVLMDHTIKFVSAVASGMWVLNFKWIEDCLARQCIISEEPYEVLDESGEPGPKTARLNHKTNKILKNFRIYAAPPFTSTTQDEVEKIIVMQGATIVKRPDCLMDKVAGEICLIITETKSTEDYDIYKTWLEQLRVVTVDLEWLVRSIGKYKLMSLKPFAMCADEAFCGLNYPDILIET